MRPKISPKQMTRHLIHSGVFALSGIAFQLAMADAMGLFRLGVTGKSRAIYSGIDFRYGNKPGRYMPHQGFRECARRRFQAQEAKNRGA